MTQAIQEKETKAQKAERLKREKNPWAAFDEVRSFARQGRSSVCRNGPLLLQVVGRLHPWRRRGGHRRQRRRRPGLRLLHDAHRDSDGIFVMTPSCFAERMPLGMPMRIMK